MIKVSDYIAKRLKEVYEIEHIFMVSGGGAMHLNDSFGKMIPYIANHHEQACAIAAEGYARVGERLAVVNVTTGPGGLNCLNGVFGQWTDSVPVLYISGQVKFTTTIASCPDINLRQLGDQEVDIISVVKPLTKYSVMVSNPNEIKYHLDKAVYEATHGRFGPVWLDIPMNVQSAIIDENDLTEFITPDIPQYELKTEEVIKKFEAAKYPLIIAGQGIRLSKQIKTFEKLLERLKVPVLTTFSAMDLVEEKHPCYIGHLGTIGQRAANFALQNADLVLCLGTRNNIRQVSYNWENFAKNAFIISVDIDKAELDKPTVTPDLKVNADLNLFLPQLEKALVKKDYIEWLKWCKDLKAKFSNPPEYDSKNAVINPYEFIRVLSTKTGENSVIVSANATPSICLFQNAVMKKGQRILVNSGNASMGYDLPASIGASLLNKNVICLAGDGSVMMNLQELQTIKNYNLPIKIFILNNRGYVSIKNTQKNFFDGRMTASEVSSGVILPDFQKIGTAFGFKTYKIDSPEKMEKQITEILSLKEAVVCEVVLDSEYAFSPKLSSKVNSDGSMTSPSLEDMYPFIPIDDIKKLC